MIGWIKNSNEIECDEVPEKWEIFYYNKKTSILKRPNSLFLNIHVKVTAYDWKVDFWLIR